MLVLLWGMLNMVKQIDFTIKRIDFSVLQTIEKGYTHRGKG